MCNFYVSIMELSHKKAFYLQLHQGFTFKDEKLICNPCRGISPSKVCDGCGMDFAPGEKKVGYERRTYHEKCFICDDCKQPIGTQQFIKKDGKRLCEKCFDSGYARVILFCCSKL